jgi:hypothetical protein
LVRVAAIWALRQLLPGSAFSGLAERCVKDETDSDVLVEWRRD